MGEWQQGQMLVITVNPDGSRKSLQGLSWKRKPPRRPPGNVGIPCKNPMGAGGAPYIPPGAAAMEQKQWQPHFTSSCLIRIGRHIGNASITRRLVPAKSRVAVVAWSQNHEPHGTEDMTGNFSARSGVEPYPRNSGEHQATIARVPVEAPGAAKPVGCIRILRGRGPPSAASNTAATHD